MKINPAGVILNSFMIFLIIVTLIFGLSANRSLQNCKNIQSPFCYTISCPCDKKEEGPCFGFAKEPGPKAGTWRCSNALYTVVDNNGKPV